MDTRTICNSPSDAPSPEYASFRDPSGVVFRKGERVLRQVHASYLAQYRALMDSGLYGELVGAGLLVAHRETGEPGLDGRAALVLEPDLIPLISYPYEWCFGQLKDAALATLRIHRAALGRGMILKDASAYNIQFRGGGAAVHIDTLSFDFYQRGMPWVAYGQFCRHFLAPLFLMAYTDIRLSQLLRVYIDGIPLDLASKLLKGKGGFAARAHIHWHAKSVLRHGQAGHAQAAGRRVEIGEFQMTAMVDSLIATVQKLALRGIETEWGDYYAHTNYSDRAAQSKKAIVAGYLSQITPPCSKIWDFGANDGTYSRLALTEPSRFVAAFDIDPVAVERNHASLKRTGENMLPLLLDLTNSSPAIGFAGRERGTLYARQRPDCVMMLAVIHHMAISNNLPLDKIAEWIASLTPWLIIEFVPKTDSQVKVLLATREDIFPEYTADGFEAAFGRCFEIAARDPVEGSDRTLYLMRRKETCA